MCDKYDMDSTCKFIKNLQDMKFIDDVIDKPPPRTRGGH